METLVAEISSEPDRIVDDMEIDRRVSHSHGQVGWHIRLARTICDRLPGNNRSPSDKLWTHHMIVSTLADYVGRARRLGQDRMTYRRGSRLGMAYHVALDDRRRGLIYRAIVTIGRHGHLIAIPDDEVVRELVLGLLAEERYQDRSLVVMPYQHP